MKQLFTLVLIVCGTLAAKAQPGDGMMSFTNLSERSVIIEIDGRQYTDCNPSLTIRSVAPGFHIVKVYSGTSLQSTKRPTIFTKRMQVKARYNIDVVINKFSRVFVDEDMTNERPSRPNNGGNYGDNRPQERTAMNSQTFENFKQTLAKESFDNSKMTIAKQVADQNMFTSEQAKDIAQLFSFSDNRVEIAKYLYGRTTDKENYFVLYNIFTFSKDKENLAAYIKNYYK